MSVLQKILQYPAALGGAVLVTLLLIAAVAGNIEGGRRLYYLLYSLVVRCTGYKLPQEGSVADLAGGILSVGLFVGLLYALVWAVGGGRKK